MILIGNDKKPENTIYFYAGVVWEILQTKTQLDFRKIEKEFHKTTGLITNELFLILAIDFLYMIDFVDVDLEGNLYVP